MDAASILLIVVAAGVNFGWQPADDAPDGLEYIVQVEPELLDGLQRGDAVPIESHVPPGVGPIRKISVVVGRGDVPRTTDRAVKRTSYLAGETTWTPDRNNPAAPAAASTYDRYGPPPGITKSAVGPPPSVIDRTQSALTETGTTLRDGLEAGIQAANRELSRGGGQVVDSTRNAGQEFGRQLQGWANDPAGQLQSTGNNVRAATERTLGTVGNQLQQVTNPFANTGSQPAANTTRTQSSVAPPPWPGTPPVASDAAASRSAAPSSQSLLDRSTAAQMAPRQTATGWTSIGSEVAPPPLLVPQLGTKPVSNANAPLQVADVTEGPRFPEPASQPVAPNNQADDWASSWANESAASQATISRNASAAGTSTRGSNLVPVQPVTPRTQTAPPATRAAEDLWADAETWGQLPPSTLVAPVAQAPDAQAGNQNDATDWLQAGNRPSLPPASNQSNQPPLREVAENTAPAAPLNGGLNGGNLPANSSPTVPNQSQQLAAPDQPPWLPLLVVSLSLMGSLSANLFLGWSYMDARQKYRSLVRKTADKFRRVAAQ